MIDHQQKIIYYVHVHMYMYSVQVYMNFDFQAIQVLFE